MKNDILLSFFAGMIGGALVIMLVINSPSTAKLFQGEKPLIPQALPESSPAEETQKDPAEKESMIVKAVEKANPAVVSIVVTKDVPIVEKYYEERPRDPFEEFFNDEQFFSPFNYRVPQYRQKGTEKREVGGGSGFLVSPDGLIVTNRHVVNQEDVEYTVFSNEGTKYDAKVLAKDSINDLAVLKIEDTDLPYLTFADSEELKVGQTAISIGNALAEFRNTVSVGVISGLSRSITAGNNMGQAEQIEEVIQTDAAINPGNSGGPLLNSSGKVIGVNVAMAMGSENIGFALPSNVANNVVQSIKETGRIIRPYLGVRYTMVTPILVENNNLPVDYGALIIRGNNASELAVIPGSPADKAGLREGDIVLEIDGTKLDNGKTLAGTIRNRQVGDTITMKVLSKGEEKTLTATLEEAPQQIK